MFRFFAAICAFVWMFLPNDAAAWSHRSNGEHWTAGTYAYRVNLQSFVDNVNGNHLSLTKTDYSWWINAAAAVWHTRTGANVHFNYLGTTSSMCGPSGQANDGVNVIAAAPAGDCWENDLGIADCGKFGYAYVYDDNIDDIEEADVCIFTPSAVEFDREGDLDSDSVDLAGLLTHEFGHTIGLAHTQPGVTSVMMSSLPRGNIALRFPYGDDIAGARDLYGTWSQSERWRHFNFTTGAIGSANNHGGSINLAPAAAVGRNAVSSWNVVRAATAVDGDRVWFNNAAYPLGSTSTWSDRFWSIDTWHSPALASWDSDAGTNPFRMVVAFPAAFEHANDCNGVTFGISDNMWSNITYSTDTSICTNSPVALGFDTRSNRYIVAWLGMANPWSSSVGTENARLFMRSSTDGISFPAATEFDTALYAGSAPSIACDSLECVLTYVDVRTDYPRARNVEFTVSASDGKISLGTGVTSSSFAGATLAAANSGGRLGVFRLWTGSYSYVARGRYGVARDVSSTAPVPYASGAIAFYSDVLPDVAHNVDRAHGYIFYAD